MHAVNQALRAAVVESGQNIVALYLLSTSGQ